MLRSSAFLCEVEFAARSAKYQEIINQANDLANLRSIMLIASSCVSSPFRGERENRVQNRASGCAVRGPASPGTRRWFAQRSTSAFSIGDVASPWRSFAAFRLHPTTCHHAAAHSRGRLCERASCCLRSVLIARFGNSFSGWRLTISCGLKMMAYGWPTTPRPCSRGCARRRNSGRD